MHNKNTILSDEQIASKHMIRNTYYSRGNYRNYNRRNNISKHYQQEPKARSTQNNMTQTQQTKQRKNHVIETAFS